MRIKEQSCTLTSVNLPVAGARSRRGAGAGRRSERGRGGRGGSWVGGGVRIRLSRGRSLRLSVHCGSARRVLGRGTGSWGLLPLVALGCW